MNNLEKILEELENCKNRTFEDNVKERLDKVLFDYEREINRYYTKIQNNDCIDILKELKK